MIYLDLFLLFSFVLLCVQSTCFFFLLYLPLFGLASCDIPVALISPQALGLYIWITFSLSLSLIHKVTGLLLPPRVSLTYFLLISQVRLFWDLNCCHSSTISLPTSRPSQFPSVLSDLAGSNHILPWPSLQLLPLPTDLRVNFYDNNHYGDPNYLFRLSS